MNDKQGKHFGERRLSEAECKRLKSMARLYRFASWALMVALPFVFVICLAVFSGLPERLPFIPFIIGGVIGIPLAIIIGILVSWERSRDLYHDYLYGAVEQAITGAVLVERLPMSQLLWSVNGKRGRWNTAAEYTPNSLYVWPDMLPGTVRKMTTVERREIFWHLFQDGLILFLILSFGYGCLELVEFLSPFREIGGLVSFGIFVAIMSLFFIIFGLFTLTLIKCVDIWENRRMTIDLMRGLVCQYYNMVSGKEIEILPYSERPWTMDEEPFIWRRENRWK